MYDPNYKNGENPANSQSVVSKLSLLSLNFPSLTIIWSKNPIHTAEIFKELKKKGGEPDLCRASKMGKVFGNEEEEKEEEVEEKVENDEPLDTENKDKKPAKQSLNRKSVEDVENKYLPQVHFIKLNHRNF